MNFYAIRGATTINADESSEIITKTKSLLTEIINQNSLIYDDIISILFTCTKDITSTYPAVAARELGMTSISLLCCQEMEVKGSLNSCIRVLMHVGKSNKTSPSHVYLEKAVVLRPDLINSNIASKKIAIAIDGPAGAGKSTIAKLLAKKLDILYLDTGAMYRAIALKILGMGGDPTNPEHVVPNLSSTSVHIVYEGGSQSVILDGSDVTMQIRTPEISKAASAVAVIPEVRVKLVEIQREIASRHSVVMDGRDIGTYVLPNADKKFFLTASVEERAKRRYDELEGHGRTQDYSTILSEIKERDSNDSNRSFAPLKKASDAFLIDTTNKTIEDVIKEINSYL